MASATGRHQAANKPSGRHTQHRHQKAAARNESGRRPKQEMPVASATGSHQAPNKPSGRHTQHPNPKRPKAATNQGGGRNKKCRWPATGRHQAPNKPSGRHTQHPNPKRPKAATNQAGGRNKNCRWRQPPVIIKRQTSPAGDTLNTGGKRWRHTNTFFTTSSSARKKDARFYATIDCELKPGPTWPAFARTSVATPSKSAATSITLTYSSEFRRNSLFPMSFEHSRQTRANT